MSPAASAQAGTLGPAGPLCGVFPLLSSPEKLGSVWGVCRTEKSSHIGDSLGVLESGAQHGCALLLVLAAALLWTPQGCSLKCDMFSVPPRKTRLVTVGLILVVGFATAPGAAQAAEDPSPEAPRRPSLPRIRVDSDSRCFRDEHGRPFCPIGVNYFRPGTGWAPQLWKRFDPEAARSDLRRLREQGFNCVRVFLTFGSFLREPNRLDPEGLAKFDRFLEIAEEAGIYVHPTGPDHWEGLPDWARRDRYGEETVLNALEFFWREFAARYRDRSVLFAYDLLNEPEIPWDTPALRTRWNRWLEGRYGTVERLAEAWGLPAGEVAFGRIGVPPREECPRCPRLLDFQRFREDLAVEWTRRQAAAIRKADPRALVTVGLIQWSVPLALAGPWHYSGFRPERVAPWLDFLEIHFYPLAAGFYRYDPQDEILNLAYLEAVVREVAAPGKPVVLAEFGWYGGGALSFGNHPPASETDQARWCGRVLEVSSPWVCGWLNWGLYDHPEARDVTQLSGLWTTTGRVKEWGRVFARWAERTAPQPCPAPPERQGPLLAWDDCLTSTAAARRFLQEWHEIRKGALSRPTQPSPTDATRGAPHTGAEPHR